MHCSKMALCIFSFSPLPLPVTAELIVTCLALLGSNFPRYPSIAYNMMEAEGRYSDMKVKIEYTKDPGIVARY